jgi:putative ATP-binding cassette transporter
MRLSGDAADNPDQRIADDITMFVDQTLTLGVGLLSAVITLVSFSVILWGISSQVPFSVAGYMFAIPGYLVWIAAAFSLIATVGAHVIGRSLIGLNFNQQRLGAEFRYALVRLRENSEQIALLGGEAAERGQLSHRFAGIVGNWHTIMSRQKTLTFFTAGYNQIAVILPYAILARPFFTGQIPLGTLMQTAGAFGQVQASFSFFVNSYARLAEWKSVVDRLSEFETQTRLADVSASNRGIEFGRGRPEAPLCLSDVHVATPEGMPLLNATYFSGRPAKRSSSRGLQVVVSRHYCARFAASGPIPADAYCWRRERACSLYRKDHTFRSDPCGRRSPIPPPSTPFRTKGCVARSSRSGLRILSNLSIGSRHGATCFRSASSSASDLRGRS